jgi:hypothetical protein
MVFGWTVVVLLAPAALWLWTLAARTAQRPGQERRRLPRRNKRSGSIPNGAHRPMSSRSSRSKATA